MGPKPDPAQELASLKNSFQAHKGHGTRRVNDCKKELAMLVNHPTSLLQLAKPIKTNLAAIRVKLEKLGELLDDIGERFPQEIDTYEGLDDSRNLLSTLYRNVEDHWLGLREKIVREYPTMRIWADTPPLGGAAPAPAAAAAGAAAGGAHAGYGPDQVDPRMAKDLKPEDLTFGAKLKEVEVWVAGFIGYARVSKLLTKQPGLQQEYLLASLRGDLRDAVKAKLEADVTPIYDPSEAVFDCMDIIHEVFLVKVPLVARRHTLFGATQNGKESLTAYGLRLEQLSRDAAIQVMSGREILAALFIIGCGQEELRTELLRLKEDPTKDTYDELKEIAARWEGARNATNKLAAQPQPARANKMSAYKQEKKGPPRQAQGKKSPNDHKLCYSCGRSWAPGHSKECPARESACNDCGQKGHFSGKPACDRQKAGRDKPKDSKKKSNSAKLNSIRVAEMGASNELNKIEVVAATSIEALDTAGKVIEAVCDTGCTVAVIAARYIETEKINKRDRRTIEIADGSHIRCKGSVDIFIEYQGLRTKVHAYVSPDVDDFYLSSHDLQTMQILPEGFPNVQLNAIKRRVKPKMDMERLKREVNAIKEANMAVFDETVLRPMRGPKVHIKLKDHVPIIPTCLYKARTIPLAYQEGARNALEEAAAGEMPLISPTNEAYAWTHPAVFVPKKDGKMRLCVDFKGLNQVIERPTRPFPTASEIASAIPASTKVLGVVDCRQGYHQLELDEVSRPLTCFITPYGRYLYNRCPMGLSSSGDEFVARSDMALAGIEGIQKLVDDILIVGDSQEQFASRFKQVVQRCKENSITLSAPKIQVGEEVFFGGMVVSIDGTKADPAKVEAIANFPRPLNQTDLRSFAGLVNQLGQFAPDLAHAMEPMRCLLKKGIAWLWLPEHEAAFVKVKRIMTHPEGPVLAHFDPKKETLVLTDASNLYGLGFCLVQVDDYDSNQGLRLIQCGSRGLTVAERNYSTVELEAQAIQWAISKAKLYTAGITFRVISDHKPLKALFNTKSLAEIENPRLRRIIEKTAGFSFDVEWVAGKSHFIADALSRYPIFNNESEDTADFEVTEGAIQLRVMTILSALTVHTDLAMEDLKKAAETDEAYQRVLRLVRTGTEPLPASTEGYLGKYFSDLSIVDGLVYFEGSRILVPRNFQAEVLETLHMAHQGVTYTHDGARQIFFWPGLKNEIRMMTEACQECSEQLPSHQREPLMLTTASRPMESVGLDLFAIPEDSRTFLIMVDRYSGYPWVRLLHKLHTAAILRILHGWFTDFGLPTHIRADGGPQFGEEFQEWCEERRIDFVPSSPYNSRSNGLAEAGVKAMKLLIRKQHGDLLKFDDALREWRNTPKRLAYSPAAIMFGRRQRTKLPAPTEAYQRLSARDFKAFDDSRELLNAKVTEEWNKRSKTLTPFAVGDAVNILDMKTRKWTIKAVVKERSDGDRTYIVEAEGGRIYKRNRRFLRQRHFRTTGGQQATKDNPVEDGFDIGDPLPIEEEEEEYVPRRSARIAQAQK